MCGVKRGRELKKGNRNSRVLFSGRRCRRGKEGEMKQDTASREGVAGAGKGKQVWAGRAASVLVSLGQSPAGGWVGGGGAPEALARGS